MAIKFGTSSISNVMLGSTQVSKVYIGSSLVWEYIVSLINYALGSNGSTAQASSVNNPLYEPSNCINGNRSGSGWLDGTGGWTSDTPLPQWIQVDFPAIRSISEMDVFTIQDNYSSPSEPTESMTFSLYGVTSCSVQYWNGSAWTNLGSSSGDYHVWKKYTFGAVVTQGIRVNVTGSTDGYARLTEVEAWGTIPSGNYAMSDNGATASASSTFSTFSASYANNGDRFGKGVVDGIGIWTGNNSLPAWLEIDFSSSKTISEIDVYTVQDDYSNPTYVTESTTFSLYGITNFSIQYWDGASWQTIQTVTGNNKVWKKFTFSPITTSKIRCYITATTDGYPRIVEMEAW